MASVISRSLTEEVLGIERQEHIAAAKGIYNHLVVRIDLGSPHWPPPRCCRRGYVFIPWAT